MERSIERPMEVEASWSESLRTFEPDASLDFVRHQLGNMVARRWTGCWTPLDEGDYTRLAERETLLLSRRSA